MLQIVGLLGIVVCATVRGVPHIVLIPVNRDNAWSSVVGLPWSRYTGCTRVVHLAVWFRYRRISVVAF